jgi:hypothetical protein
MSTRQDVKPLEPELAEPAGPATDRPATTGPQPVGRIVHDNRGNAVWKWGGDTSSTGTTSGVLKYVDASDLSVEGQASGAGATGGKQTRVFDSGGGYDPYNQGEPRTRPVTPQKGNRGKR